MLSFKRATLARIMALLPLRVPMNAWPQLMRLDTIRLPTMIFTLIARMAALSDVLVTQAVLLADLSST